MSKIRACLTLFAALILSSLSYIAQAQDAESPAPIKEYKIIALVPLSGESAAVGKNMLGAMQLALLDLKADQFDLVPVDSESPAEQIVVKLKELSPNAVLGPVYSKDMKKILPLMQYVDTCFISFSNDRDISGQSCTMLMGFMPEESVKQVTSYAAGQGYRINALLPKNKYGLIVGEVLNFLKSSNQITIGEVEFYEPGNAHDSATKLFEKLSSSISSEKQALLIPDHAALTSIAPVIKDKNIKLLGSSQFEDERLFTSHEMQGAWFASAPKTYRDKFERKFALNFDAKPLKISSLAYDAAAFSYVMLMNSPDGKLSKSRVTDPIGFAGITGTFRFLQDGSNQRSLSVFEIRDGKMLEIEPAKQGF